MSKKLFQKFAAVLLALCLTLGSMPTIALSDALEPTSQPTQSAEPTTVSSEPTAAPTAKPAEESEGADNGESAGEPNAESGAQPTATPTETAENPGEDGTAAPENSQNPGEEGDNAPQNTENAGDLNGEATPAPETTETSAPEATPAPETTATAVPETTATAVPETTAENTTTPAAEPTEVATPDPEATPTMPAAQDVPLEGENTIAPFSDEGLALQSSIDYVAYKYIVFGLSQTAEMTLGNGKVKLLTRSAAADSYSGLKYYFKVGDTIQFTVTPDEYYVVDSVKAYAYADTANKTELTVTPSSNNQYSVTFVDSDIFLAITYRDTRKVDEISFKLQYKKPDGSDFTNPNLNAQAYVQNAAGDRIDSIYTTQATTMPNMPVGEYTLTDFKGSYTNDTRVDDDEKTFGQKYFVSGNEYKFTLTQEDFVPSVTSTGSGSMTVSQEDGVWVFTIQVAEYPAQKTDPELTYDASKKISRKIGDYVDFEKDIAPALFKAEDGNGNAVPGAFELKADGTAVVNFYYNPEDTTKYTVCFYPSARNDETDTSSPSDYFNEKAFEQTFTISDFITQQTPPQIAGLSYVFNEGVAYPYPELTWTAYWSTPSPDYTYKCEVLEVSENNTYTTVLEITTITVGQFQWMLNTAQLETGTTYAIGVTALYKNEPIEGSRAIASETFSLMKVNPDWLGEEKTVVVGRNIRSFLNAVWKDTFVGEYKLIRNGNTRTLTDDDVFTVGDDVKYSWRILNGSLQIYLPCTLAELPDSSRYNNIEFLNNGSITVSYTIDGMKKDAVLNEDNYEFAQVLASLGYDTSDTARLWKINGEVFDTAALMMKKAYLAETSVESSYRLRVSVVNDGIFYFKDSKAVDEMSVGSNDTIDGYFFRNTEIECTFCSDLLSLDGVITKFEVNGVSFLNAVEENTYSFTMPAKYVDICVEYGINVSTQFGFELMENGTAISKDGWKFKLDGAEMLADEAITLAMGHVYTLQPEAPDSLAAIYEEPGALRFMLLEDGSIQALESDSGISYKHPNGKMQIEWELTRKLYEIKLVKGDNGIAELGISTALSCAAGKEVKLTIHMAANDGTNFYRPYSLEMKTASGEAQSLECEYDPSAGAYTASFTMPAEKVTLTARSCKLYAEPKLYYADGNEVLKENGTYIVANSETIYARISDDDCAFNYCWMKDGATLSEDAQYTVNFSKGETGWKLSIHLPNGVAVGELEFEVSVAQVTFKAYNVSGYQSYFAGSTFMSWYESKYDTYYSDFDDVQWGVKRATESGYSSITPVDANTRIRPGDIYEPYWYILQDGTNRELHIVNSCTVDMLPSANRYYEYVIEESAQVRVTYGVYGYSTLLKKNLLTNATVWLNSTNYSRTIEDWVGGSNYYYIGTEEVSWKQLPLEYTVIRTGSTDNTRYSFTIPEVENCTIKATYGGYDLAKPVSKLWEKDSVSLTITANPGYSVKSVQLLRASDNTVYKEDSVAADTKELSFDMPAYDLKLQVELEPKSYSITVVNGDEENLTITCDHGDFKAGGAETITMTLEYDPDKVEVSAVKCYSTTDSSKKNDELKLSLNEEGKRVYTFPVNNGDWTFEVVTVKTTLNKIRLNIENPLTDSLKENISASLEVQNANRKFTLKPGVETEVYLPRISATYWVKWNFPADCPYNADGITIGFNVDADGKITSALWRKGIQEADMFTPTTDASGTPRITVSGSLNKTEDIYTLTIEKTNGGYVYAIPNNTYVEAGSYFEVCAIPAKGYMIKCDPVVETDAANAATWSRSENNPNIYSFTMPVGNLKISFEFVQCAHFTVIEDGKRNNYTMPYDDNGDLYLQDWITQYGGDRYSDQSAYYIWASEGENEFYLVNTSCFIYEGTVFVCLASVKDNVLRMNESCKFDLLEGAASDCTSASFARADVTLYNVKHNLDGEEKTFALSSAANTIQTAFTAMGIEIDKLYDAQHSEVDLTSTMPLQKTDFYTRQYAIQTDVHSDDEENEAGTLIAGQMTAGGFEEINRANAGEKVLLKYTEAYDYIFDSLELYQIVEDGEDVKIDLAYDETNELYCFIMPEGDVSVRLILMPAVHFEVDIRGTRESLKTTAGDFFLFWSRNNGYTSKWNELDAQGWVTGEGEYVEASESEIEEGDLFLLAWELSDDGNGGKQLNIYQSFDAENLPTEIRELNYVFMDSDAQVTTEHIVNDNPVKFVLSSDQHDLSDFLEGKDVSNWYYMISYGSYQLIDWTQSHPMPLAKNDYQQIATHAVRFISTNLPEGCEVDTSAAKVRYEGSKDVTFTVRCPLGYELRYADVILYMADGEAGEITPWELRDLDYVESEGYYRCTFTVWHSDVEIEVVPHAIDYSITVPELYKGAIICDQKTANYGETVTFTIEAAEGYGLSELEVEAEGGTVVPVASLNGIYSFTMPAADVEMTAKFLPKMTVNTSFTVTIPSSVNLNQTDKMKIQVSDFVDFPVDSYVFVKVDTGDIENDSRGYLTRGDYALPYSLSDTAFHFSDEGSQTLEIKLEASDAELKNYIDGEYTGMLYFSASICHDDC